VATLSNLGCAIANGCLKSLGFYDIVLKRRDELDALRDLCRAAKQCQGSIKEKEEATTSGTDKLVVVLKDVELLKDKSANAVFNYCCDVKVSPMGAVASSVSRPPNMGKINEVALGVEAVVRLVSSRFL